MTTATLPAIAREVLTPDLARELRPLIAANHAATGKAGRPDPAWPAIYQVAGNGDLCLLVARVDGRPVGYCAHAAVINHGTSQLNAVCLAIYLDPAHRMLTRALVRQAEEAAKDAGCHAITFSVPHMSRSGSFFEAIGYDCLELVMARQLV